MHRAVMCTAAVVAICLAFVPAATAAAVQDHACGTRHPTAQEVCTGRIALRMSSIVLQRCMQTATLLPDVAHAR